MNAMRDDTTAAGCQTCGHPAEVRTCERCGRTATVIDCGHSAQPCEIAADEYGAYICDDCARGPETC